MTYMNLLRLDGGKENLFKDSKKLEFRDQNREIQTDVQCALDAVLHT